jgi:pimeloyl-ACP methyl ester carboxylesterase
VKALLKVLRQMGFTEFHVMGHSYGGVSSHWLSLHLGEELKSVIHSAAQSGSPPLFNADLAKSMKDFPHDAVKTEVLYLHHQDDLCFLTPYSYAKAHARSNRLVTVIGGDRSGPACGAGSFHSYLGRRAQVAEALVRWIKDGEVVPVVKGPLD